MLQWDSLPPLGEWKGKYQRSDKQRRKGACLSGCQSANKSQSSANAFSSPIRLSLFKDTVMCTLKNSRRWKQSPRPLCLTVEEEKGRGENPQLQGFNRLQHWSAPAASPIYHCASIIYRFELYADIQSDVWISVHGKAWRRVREEHLLAQYSPPCEKTRGGGKRHHCITN